MIAAAVVAPIGPERIWRAWTFDPLVVLALVGSVALYTAGFRRLRGRGRRPGRALAFGAALLAAAIALVSPLDAMAEATFSAHMVQHLVLIVVVAPLLVVSRPFRTILAGLPRRARRSIARAGAELGSSRLGRAFHRPAVAWAVFAIALWGWHLPALYDAAVLDPSLHALEHLAFLGTSVLTWAVALDPRRREGLAPLGRALFLLACGLQSGLLGALLLFAPSPLYPVHGVGPALWGLTPLRDQQLAGAIMWVPPSGVYLVVAVVLLVRWFRWMDARSPAEPDRAEVAA